MRMLVRLLLVLVAGQVGAADIYKCVNGAHTVFQDKPCPGAVPTNAAATTEASASCDDEIKRWRQAEDERLRKQQVIPVPAPECLAEQNRRRQADAAAAVAAEEKSRAAAAEYDRKLERQRADACGRTPMTRQAILQQKAIVGMTADEARCALNKRFIRVNRTISVYGVSEQWVVEDGGSSRQYLYFNGGILTTIQD